MHMNTHTQKFIQSKYRINFFLLELQEVKKLLSAELGVC